MPPTTIVGGEISVSGSSVRPSVNTYFASRTRYLRTRWRDFNETWRKYLSLKRTLLKCFQGQRSKIVHVTRYLCST